MTVLTRYCRQKTRTERSKELKRELRQAGAERLLYVGEAFREGLNREEVHELTRIDPWFLAQIEDLIRTEETVQKQGLEALDKTRLFALKQKGFSDSRLASLVGCSELAVA